ncbi:DUF551 domain-containing protein [Klebsiella pneumoniae]|nr:DUF551 domain-containing protein [Klebsiella pneumoniae]HBY1726090.1 DUF551 domain-containing protein [Klebsiella pneumoniae]
MTKSTITRERIEQYANDPRMCNINDEIRELARIALAAIDSEPVAYISKSDFDAGYPHILARRDFNKACTMPVYAAQPAPVVPEEWTIAHAVKFCKETGRQDAGAAMDAWNACRAAMLQELKKSAGTKAICRSDENVQVLHTKSPAQSDCCPAQNSVTPAQGGNSLVIPDEMTSEQAYEIGYYYGDPVDVFARGANWMRQHIIDSTLAAAPQLPGSEPATVPGKWIPVSVRMPPSRHEVLVGRWWGEKPRWCCKWATYIPGHPDAQSSGWLIPGASWTPTHWMPLPAAPQEVKSES